MKLKTKLKILAATVIACLLLEVIAVSIPFVFPSASFSYHPPVYRVTLTERQRDSICAGSTHVDISEIQIRQQ